MFHTKGKSTSKVRKNLEAGRSVEITVPSFGTISGIVDFVSIRGTEAEFTITEAQTRYHVRKSITGGLSCILSIINAVEKKEYMTNGMRVMYMRKWHQLSNEFMYQAEESVETRVPVSVGDFFAQNGKRMEIKAISSDGKSLFAEDENGKGIQVRGTDKSLMVTVTGIEYA